MPGKPERRDQLRLRRGVALIPIEDGLVVEGLRNRHVFRGRSAKDLLPKVLARLDGASVPQPSEPAQLSWLLDVLSERGVLERRRSAERVGGPSEDVTAFFARQTSANADGMGADDVLDALAAATVYVVGAEPLTTDLAGDLRECGIGHVLGPDALFADPEEPAGPRLALVLEGLDAAGRTERALDRCGELGIPVLRAAVFGDYLELGPTFLDDLAICPECLRRARSAANWPETPTACGPAAASVLTGLVTMEAVAFTGGLPYPRSPQTVIRVDTRTWEIERHLLTREPGCPRCDDTPPGGFDPMIELVTAYEESLTPTGPAPDQSLVNLGKIKEAGQYRPALTSHPSLPLPAARQPSGTFGDPPCGDPTALNAGFIGEILRRVAGRRSGPEDPADQRWAPTGGNMASVELYVSHEAGLEGLSGTLFRYDDLDHRLIAVSRTPAATPELAAVTDLAGLPLETLFVFVAAVDRLSVKYGEFAYRLAALDAGCATTQLTGVCHGYGRSVVFARRWDERMAQMLRVGPDDRFVTAVAGVLR